MSTDRRVTNEPLPQPTSAQPAVLTPEKLRDLLKEGRSLRGPLERRLAAIPCLRKTSSRAPSRRARRGAPLEVQ